MVRVGDVGLVEAVDVDGLPAVADAEKMDRGGGELIRFELSCRTVGKSSRRNLILRTWLSELTASEVILVAALLHLGGSVVVEGLFSL